MTVRVGTAEVSVVPSFAGFAKAAKSQTSTALKETEATARVSGEKSGKNYSEGFRQRDEHGKYVSQETEKSGKGAGEEGKKTGKRFGGGFLESMKGFGEAIAAYWVADKVIEFFKESIVEGTSAGVVQAQLAARLKSTGDAAGLTKKDLIEQADATARLTATTAQSQEGLEGLLLTFTNIKGAIFQEALPAVNDIAAAMHESGQSAAVQLGKALNDPIAGMTALRRVGIQLSTQQQDQVKAWVKNGEVAKAQGLIIAEVEKEMGGAAEANVTPMAKLHATVANLEEEVGLKLLPTFNKFAGYMANKAGPAIAQFVQILFGVEPQGEKVSKTLEAVATSLRETLVSAFRIAGQVGGDFIKGFTNDTKSLSGIDGVIAGIGSGIRTAVDFMAQHPKAAKDFAVALLAVAAAYKVLSAVAKAYAVIEVIVDALNVPMLIAAAAILVVAVAVYEIYKHWAGFSGFFVGLYHEFWDGFLGPIWKAMLFLYHDVFDPIWHAMVAVGRFFVDAYRYVVAALIGLMHNIEAVAKGVWHAILAAVNFFVTGFHNSMAAISFAIHIVEDVLGAIKSAFVAAWQWIYTNFVLPAKAGLTLVWHILEIAWLAVGKPTLEVMERGFHRIADVVGQVVGWVVARLQAAWAGMKVVWGYIDRDVIQKFLAGFRMVRDWVGSVLAWVEGRLRAAWAGMKTIWGYVDRDVIQKFVAGFRTVQAWVALALAWVEGRLRAAWTGMKTLWGYIDRDVIQKFVAGFRLLQAWVLLAIGYVEAGWRTLWNTLKGIWAAIWRDAIGPMIRIVDTMWKTWKNGLDKVTGFFKSFYTNAKQIFSDVVKAIGSAWTGFERTMAVPVNWVIKNVYTDGLEKMWNAAANKIDKGLKLPDISPLHFATGGVVPGAASAGDNIPIYATAGEGVLTLPEMAALGGPGGFQALREMLTGRRATQGGAGGHYDLGGIIGGIGKALRGGLAAVFKPGVTSLDKIIDGYIGGDQGVKKLIGTAPKKLLDAALSYLSGDDGKNKASGAGQSFSSRITAGGSVHDWFTQAMALTGTPTSWLSALETIGSYESGFNPNSINLTDSNAQAGHPSQGIMQTIPSTFSSNHQPGTSWNINDPVANIAAAINYIKGRYGTVFNVPGIRNLAAGGGYVGYANGGAAGPGSFVVGEDGPEVVTTRQRVNVIPNGGGEAKTFHVHLNWDGKEIQHKVVKIVGDELVELANMGTAGS